MALGKGNGAALSFAAMWVALHWSRLSIVGVSMAGGVFHMVGQLAVVAFTFLPYVALAGIAAVGAGVALDAEPAMAKLEPKIAAPDDPSVVIDVQGNEVAVSERIERVVITCNGCATHEAIIFDGADKIMTEPLMQKFPQLLKMSPELNDVVSDGLFDDVNVEVIATTEPDFALCGVSSEKGNAQTSELGIPVYVMLIGWAAVDSLKQEFLNVGHLFGNDELVAYWNEKMAQIAERVEKIPEEERTRTVYYLSSTNIIRTNTGDWGACGSTRWARPPLCPRRAPTVTSSLRRQWHGPPTSSSSRVAATRLLCSMTPRRKT